MAMHHAPHFHSLVEKFVVIEIDYLPSLHLNLFLLQNFHDLNFDFIHRLYLHLCFQNFMSSYLNLIISSISYLKLKQVYSIYFKFQLKLSSYQEVINSELISFELEFISTKKSFCLNYSKTYSIVEEVFNSVSFVFAIINVLPANMPSFFPHVL